MPNYFSTQKSNQVANPPIKNDVEYGSGRLRQKVEKYLTGLDAALGEIIFTSSFKLSDVIMTVEIYSSADLTTTTFDLGAYIPQTLATTTPVLAPIPGSTSAANRFATVAGTTGAKPLSGGVQLWGESGIPTTHMPLWEALGYASFSAALVDIPGGRVDLGVTFAGLNPIASTLEIRIVYTAGD